MNYFLNYENGKAQINTYRAASASVTDIKDIERAMSEESEEILTASIDSEEDRKRAEALCD